MAPSKKDSSTERLARLEVHLLYLRDKADQQGRSLETIQRKVDGWDECCARHRAECVEGLDERFGSIDESMEAVANDVEQIKSTVAHLDSGFELSQTTVDEITSKARDLVTWRDRVVFMASGVCFAVSVVAGTIAVLVHLRVLGG